MSTSGQKHLVKCRCVLPQFKKRQEPKFHEFVVFSKIINSEFIESFAQCNNCGIVHRVIDICKSKIIASKENMPTIPTIEEIAIGLPSDLSNLLKINNSDLATYQYAAFIIEQKLWDTRILLQKESADEFVVGKFLTFLKNERFRVEPFSYQMEIKRG